MVEGRSTVYLSIKCGILMTLEEITPPVMLHGDERLMKNTPNGIVRICCIGALLFVFSISSVAQDCLQIFKGVTIESKSTTCPLVGGSCYTQFQVDGRTVPVVCQFPWFDFDDCDQNYNVNDCISVKGHYGPFGSPEVVFFVEGLEHCD